MSFEQPSKFDFRAPEQKPEKEPKPWEQELIGEYEKKARKYFGERKNIDYYTETDEGRQWWFFSPRSEKEKEERLKETDRVEGLSYPARDAFKEGIEQGKRFMAEHLDEICQEYKIHLQPTRKEYNPRQGDWRPFCVNKLIQALAENPAFKESINIFKVSYQKEIKKSNTGEVIPEIVIYPRLGRENFGKALSGIYQHFKGYEKYGSDMIPRYNQKINELIFVAQSGGDLKDSLKDFGVLDEYFDKTNNYAFRKGEKPPLTVDGSKSFMELFVALECTSSKGLRGTEKLYEIPELKKLINKVRGGELSINHITRTGGLREKVEELLKTERMKK